MARKKKPKTLITETISIKGLDWKFSVQDEDIYKKDHGSESHGITDREALHIFILKSSLNIETILHELGHAYFHSCLVYTTDQLDNDDVEEIFCEIIGMHGISLVKQAQDIYKYLKKELEDNE